MGQGNRTREAQRRAKLTERDGAMDAPDMSNVVQIGRTNARGETTMSPAEFAARAERKVVKTFGLEGFETVKRDAPEDEGGAVEVPAEPAEKAGEEPVDPALEELIGQTNLDADEGGENHNDDSVERPGQEMNAMDNEKSETPIEKARREAEELLADVDREVEEHREQGATAPEILEQVKKLLEREEEYRKTLPSAAVKVRTAINGLLEANPVVSRLLAAEEKARKFEAEKVAAAGRQAQMAELYADLPDDQDAEPYPDGTKRKINSPTAVLAATHNKGDTAFLVVRLKEGTIVPTEKGGRTRLGTDAHVQIKIVVDKVEGTGDDRRVYREAHVKKWVGPLYFHAQKAWKDGAPGVFSIVPRYFTKDTRNDPDARKKDPFDSLKEAIYIVHNREYFARMQAEGYEKAKTAANLTVSKLILDGMVGSAVAEADWVVKTQGDRDAQPREYSRHLEVVLKRDEKDGAVHVAAWGPPAVNRFSPRLYTLQPQKGGVIVPLEVEVKVTGGTYVRFSPKDETLTDGQDDRAKNARTALHDLAMCVRQALINERAASASVEKSSPPEPPDADGKGHRHHYRKDGTCRCSATQTSEAAQ